MPRLNARSVRKRLLALGYEFTVKQILWAYKFDKQINKAKGERDALEISGLPIFPGTCYIVTGDGMARIPQPIIMFKPL